MKLVVTIGYTHLVLDTTTTDLSALMKALSTAIVAEADWATGSNSLKRCDTKITMTLEPSVTITGDDTVEGQLAERLAIVTTESAKFRAEAAAAKKELAELKAKVEAL